MHASTISIINVTDNENASPLLLCLKSGKNWLA